SVRAHRRCGDDGADDRYMPISVASQIGRCDRRRTGCVDDLFPLIALPRYAGCKKLDQRLLADRHKLQGGFGTVHREVPNAYQFTVTLIDAEIGSYEMAFSLITD